MILKRIEIFGFKSFGKKVTIDFNENITAVVGPNGSGKSNITDAIRWVMGEQRIKSLRGSKMEDVVFAGSNEKKPLGYALVTIVLDNSNRIFDFDYDEIEVTRKYFRSGESEYYINRTKVRLRDVQAIFMDTGLGHEGYSVVSQGQIESIVMNSPQERKLLIEEAAGIVKYRVRKEEAEKKLSRASDNLDRIKDIIAATEDRLPTLKKQSEKAMKFLELREELKGIEVGMFVHRMDMLGNVLDRNVAVRDSYTESIKGIDEEITQLDEKYRRLKIMLTDFDERIYRVNNNMQSLMDSYNSAKVNYEVSVRELEKLKKDYEDGSAEEDESEENLKDLYARKELAQKELNAKNGMLSSLTEGMRTFREKSTSLLNGIRDAEARLRLLEGYENSMEGYKYAIRQLMKLKETNPVLRNGLYTTVGEIVDTDKRYAEALTKALGSSMSYMITEDESVASECIRLLKQQKMGRVTFLPKNIIRDSGRRDGFGIEKCRGFIGFANTLAKCPEEFRGIVDNLLSGVAVVDTLDNANYAARTTRYRLRIVTLDGEVLYPGGALAGGASKNDDEGSIRRRSEISELRKDCEEKRKAYDELLSSRNTASEEEVLSLRDEISAAGERIRSLQSSIDYFAEQKQKRISKRNADEKEIERLGKFIESCTDMDRQYREKREAIEKEREELQRSRLDSDKMNGEINDSMRTLNAERNDLSAKLSAVQVEIGKTETELEHLQKDMMEDYGLTYASAVPFKTEIEDMDSELGKIAELKDKIKKLGNINPDSVEEYKEVKARYEEMCYQRDDLIRSRDELDHIISDLSKSMEKQFVTQLALIQKEFNGVFTELFGGGEADLVLTDPDDVMLSGIDIVACPPHAKKMSIQALSGGEKSMTAIALIFAILRIKPSPFCVLDEIDAALDDSNIGRICRYLLGIVKDNQFIIVTHKKITMEIASTLYGVSMGSDGISQVVSVKLDDIDDYTE